MRQLQWNHHGSMGITLRSVLTVGSHSGVCLQCDSELYGTLIFQMRALPEKDELG